MVAFKIPRKILPIFPTPPPYLSAPHLFYLHLSIPKMPESHPGSPRIPSRIVQDRRGLVFLLHALGFHPTPVSGSFRIVQDSSEILQLSHWSCEWALIVRILWRLLEDSWRILGGFLEDSSELRDRRDSFCCGCWGGGRIPSVNDVIDGNPFVHHWLVDYMPVVTHITHVTHTLHTHTHTHTHTHGPINSRWWWHQPITWRFFPLTLFFFTPSSSSCVPSSNLPLFIESIQSWHLLSNFPQFATQVIRIAVVG